MRASQQQNVKTLQKTVKFFEAVLAASQDCVVITDEAATILVANQSFCSLFSCSPGELVETSLFDWLSAFVGDPLSTWTSLQKEISRTGTCSNVGFELMTSTGPKFFSVNASSRQLEDDEEREDSAIISIWRDITQQKNTEAALSRANTMLEQRVAERTEELRLERDNFVNLLKAMKDGCYIVCEQHDIHFVNKALAADFGPWQESKCYEYFHRRSEPCPWCKNDQVFAGETIHWEWYSELINKTYDIIETPMEGPEGAHWKLLMFRDITERIQAEQEKEKTAAELLKAKKMEALGMMAGSVAHDLNNILVGIVGYPELLLMKLPADSPMIKWVEAIRESGRKAAKVVADLLVVARGASTIREPYNLNLLIREYLSSPDCERLKALYPNIKFQQQLEAKHQTVLCSSIHVWKCLMNLVINAAEAIGSDTDGSITISSQNQFIESTTSSDHMKKGEYLVLSVQDNGPGIPANELEHVFEPFYTKKVMGRSGTGLGLTIAWNTMRDHEGQIQVESNEQGTCFLLYFPVAAHAASICIENDELQLLDTCTNPGKRILLVDKEEQTLDVTRSMLESLGYTVDTACSGEQALQFIKDTAVDLVMLDMALEPGVNGRQVYEEILKLYPGQKALIASGYNACDDAKAALEMGESEFIQKPYSLSQLGKAVRDILNKKP
ncbi:MAG: ATP-binding protein [Candidatus Electrothrix scaldis]|nr:MAG: ATP-binding protein [Candidatus Electrothrix sp. GW3-3]